MASLATAVDHVECAHDLEAGVRELRLLAAHAPPYNRRSKFPHRWWWVVLTDEAFPRFSAVRAPKHDCALGPFRSRADAARRPRCWPGSPGCGHARRGWAGRRRTARVPGTRSSPRAQHRATSAPPTTPRPAARPRPDRRCRHPATGDMLSHITDLAGRARYETAARLRDNATTAIEVLWRGQRLRALAASARLVAARPDGAGGWRLAVIRNGQLAAAGTRPRGVPPMPVVDAICAGAQAVLPSQAPLGGALVEETALIARWLTQPGVRIVRAESGYASPVGSAGRLARTGPRRPASARTGGRTTRRNPFRLRASDRTPPNARAAFRRRRSRSPRRPAPDPTPTQAPTWRRWTARHEPPSRRRH